MPNHCMNKVRMEFQDSNSKKQLRADLEKLGDQKANLCQLIFRYDDETRKMILPDGTVEVLEEGGHGYPVSEYWGTKWGTYDANWGLDENLILEYYFNTAWCPVGDNVLLELVKKYNMVSIVNNYWEPGVGFAGTKKCYLETLDVSYTEHDYDIICTDSMKYCDFVELVRTHYTNKDGSEVSDKALKSLFEKIQDYEYMYTCFEQQAYQALVDAEATPMFNTFIANNLQ